MACYKRQRRICEDEEMPQPPASQSIAPSSCERDWEVPREEYEYTPFGNVNYADVLALFENTVCPVKFYGKAHALGLEKKFKLSTGANNYEMHDGGKDKVKKATKAKGKSQK